jgi:cell division transport system permease protein
VASSIKEDLKSFRRSWVHHTGMQLATLTVLGATFTVVIFFLSFSLNLKRILASWGDGVQITAYIKDDVSDDSLANTRQSIEALREFRDIQFIAREAATESFKKQMASYAPDLLSDAEFAHPFPASFRLTLKGGAASEGEVHHLEEVAAQLQKIPGIEDVSYGQSWLKNYASFVTTLYSSSWAVAAVLVFGSLFVIGNSIRSSISSRREEIEILELVGATSAMIRRPYIAEGLFMGAMAAALAIGLNFAAFVWEKSVLSSSVVLSRLVSMVSFLDVFTVVAMIAFGALIGAVGAWLSVRKINDGWSARQGLEV